MKTVHAFIWKENGINSVGSCMAISQLFFSITWGPLVPKAPDLSTQTNQSGLVWDCWAVFLMLFGFKGAKWYPLCFQHWINEHTFISQKFVIFSYSISKAGKCSNIFWRRSHRDKASDLSNQTKQSVLSMRSLWCHSKVFDQLCYWLKTRINN